jgi:hypothetical protein
MKYEPLKRHLEGSFQHGEIRLGFAEIERILGFALPPSAYEHPAWWSNTRAGHSHAAAWLDAGWKTAALDRSARKVSFVKADDVPAGVAEESAPFQHLDSGSIVLSPSALSPRALRMIDYHVETNGGDRVSACAALLDQLAEDRLAAMFDWFQKASKPSTIPSAELIREDRDSDER